jgi:cupin superfamily acireductone dioxygenase involved in methionine salvage
MINFYYIETNIESKPFPNFYLGGISEEYIKKVLKKKGYKDEEIISITNKGNNWNEIAKQR